MKLKEAIAAGKIELSDTYKNEASGTQELFFDAPKELLGDRYPNAVMADIRVEFPLDDPSGEAASIEFSPVDDDGDDGYVSTDWNPAELFDPDLSVEDINKLIAMAN